jgi:hypothetical protein
MDPRVIAGTFENGLMGIEVPAAYGGAEVCSLNLTTKLAVLF